MQAQSSIAALQLPLPSLGSKADAVATTSLLRMPSEEAEDDEPATEVPLPSPEEGDDVDGSVSLLDQDLVICDYMVPANSSDEEATALARLGRIGFFLALKDGRERFNALIDYTAEACMCPLCSWSTSFAPPLVASKAVGYFAMSPPRDRTKWATYLKQRGKDISFCLETSNFRGRMKQGREDSPTPRKKTRGGC